MRPALRSILCAAAAIALALGCDRQRTLAGQIMPCDGESGQHLPFHALDLGLGSPPRAPYVTGPEGHEVVTDSAQWRDVWSRYAPSLPVPPVAFRDSVVLLVATRAYTSGQRTVRIVDVQRCPSGLVAVVTQTEGRYMQHREGERTIAAVAMDRALIGAAAVQFVQLADHWSR
ncbi:MAG TPA: hypothetical protein VF461_13860 [Gemmatimonadaceae bacterium]